MEMWRVRTLDRNISTQYYERHFVQPSLPMSESEPNKFELLKLRAEIERQKHLFILQHTHNDKE